MQTEDKKHCIQCGAEMYEYDTPDTHTWECTKCLIGYGYNKNGQIGLGVETTTHPVAKPLAIS
jgi:hypothetical protein